MSTLGTNRLIGGLAGALVAIALALPAVAAEVNFERLKNAQKEPQNWLTVHKDYNSTRYMAVDQINRDNVRNLKVAFTVALGGYESGGDKPTSRQQSTPLVEDGFMYVTDGWSSLYKVDVRDGKKGLIVWKMDPGVDKSTVWIPANRGASMYGNWIIHVTTDGRLMAVDKENGKVVWEKDVKVAPTDGFTAPPLIIKDMIVAGATGGDIGGRCWIAGFDAKTGELKWRTYAVPAPGEPGSETWGDKNNAWKTGGGAFWYTGAYDPELNLTYWGTGQPVPMFDAEYRPGDNLFTNSTMALNPDTGKMAWYFQYTPGDYLDYDEIGSHMLADVTIQGQPRKVLSRFARNGFYYQIDRTNGSFITADQYVKQLNWTKGIDPKTGKPVEYNPNNRAGLQVYAAEAMPRRGKGDIVNCPDIQGGVNMFPTAISPKAGMAYGAGIEGCNKLRTDQTRMNGPFWNGGIADRHQRMNGILAASDLATGKVKAQKVTPYPIYSGVLATAGGVVYTAQTDGTITGHNDQTLDELWSFNAGTHIQAPPMSYSVGGKQYIAIVVGGGTIFKTGLLKGSPETHNIVPTSMIMVFSL